MKKTLLIFSCFLLIAGFLLSMTEVPKSSIKTDEITSIPSIRITTKDPHEVINHEEYVDAYISVSDGKIPDKTPIKIRGRGNSTWGNRKNPMIFTFSNDTPVFGMEPAKKWVLISNYTDKTLMRNYLAGEFAASFSNIFVPETIMCDVYYNQTYLGVYGLAEKVEITDSRINDSYNGVLLEIDGAYNGENMFRTAASPSPFVFSELDDNGLSNSLKSETELEIKYIESLIVNKNKRVFKFINAESFVDWFIVNDFFKNCDSAFYSSCFLYKNKDKKYVMGPIWDFDVSLGNTAYRSCDDPEGELVATAGWYKYLLEMPEFREMVNKKWTFLRDNGNVDSIFANIAKVTDFMGDSVEKNYKAWDTLSMYCWPNVRVNGSFDSEVEYLKEFLIRRIQWYDSKYYTGDADALRGKTDVQLASCLPYKINSYNREWAGKMVDYLESKNLSVEKCEHIREKIKEFDERPDGPVITYPAEDNVLQLESSEATLKWELPQGFEDSFVTITDTTDNKVIFERASAGKSFTFTVKNCHRYDFKVEIKLADGRYVENDMDKLHSFAAFVLPEKFNIIQVRRVGGNAVISWEKSPDAKYYTIGVVDNKTSKILVNVEYVPADTLEYAFEIPAVGTDCSVYVMAHANEYEDVYSVYRLAENSQYRFSE